MEISSLIMSLGFLSTQQVTRIKYRICWKLFSPLLTVQLAMEEEMDISSRGVFSNQTPSLAQTFHHYRLTDDPWPHTRWHHSSGSALYLVSQRQDISSKSCMQPAFLSFAPLFFITVPRTFVPGDTKGVGFMPCSHTVSAVSPLPVLTNRNSSFF